MIELDAGISGQIALVQQKAALALLKQTANAEKQIADVLLQTVTAGQNGQTVDLYA